MIPLILGFATGSIISHLFLGQSIKESIVLFVLLTMGAIGKWITDKIK